MQVVNELLQCNVNPHQTGSIHWSWEHERGRDLLEAECKDTTPQKLLQVVTRLSTGVELERARQAANPNPNLNPNPALTLTLI